MREDQQESKYNVSCEMIDGNTYQSLDAQIYIGLLVFNH